MTDATTWSCARCSTFNASDAPACTGCLTPRPELLSLPALGAFIAAKLREHFPAATERDRQVLALAEEAGEFVGAYRRAAGMARRTGTWDDVEAELADVAITAYVTAHVLDLDVDDLPAECTGRPIFPAPTGDADTDRRRAALNVSSAVGWFADGYLLDLNPVALGSALHTVVLAVQHAAHVLGIDLPAAVQAKTAHILTRGWRDTTPPAPAGTSAEATR
jgi:NTP pyrophosphatase (non-canonical NTP hydrolase)